MTGQPVESAAAPIPDIPARWRPSVGSALAVLERPPAVPPRRPGLTPHVAACLQPVPCAVSAAPPGALPDACALVRRRCPAHPRPCPAAGGPPDNERSGVPPLRRHHRGRKIGR